MNDLQDALAFFHFLRPGWLALIPPALVLWWRVRIRLGSRTELPGGLAPHLAAALQVGGGRRLGLHAIDGVVLTLLLVLMTSRADIAYLLFTASYKF